MEININIYIYTFHVDANVDFVTARDLLAFGANPFPANCWRLLFYCCCVYHRNLNNLSALDAITRRNHKLLDFDINVSQRNTDGFIVKCFVLGTYAIPT